MFVTLQTVEQMSQHLFSALNGDDPFANHPGRIMADMLIVAAGELRNPMTFVIGMVSGNRLFHEQTSRNGQMGLANAGLSVSIVRQVTARNAYPAVFEIMLFLKTAPG